MNELPKRIQVAIALFVLGVAVILGAFVSFYNQSALESELNKRIQNQQSVLYELAEITDRNGTDETLAGLIRDCGNRTVYESLLVKLETLSKQELLTLQSFSESCGRFFPETKAIMATRLEREFDAYTELIDLIKLLNSDKVFEYSVNDWAEIIELEHTRADLLNELNDIQVEIIQLLIQGNSSQSTMLQEQVKNAQKVNVLLKTHDTRIDELRASIIQ